MEGAVEIWRVISGHEFYLVSTLGRVYSVRAGKVLRPGRKSSGHLNVCLGRGQENNLQVHALVLTTFCRPPFPGEEARHLDDEPSHNALYNLRWGSRSQNGRDKKWNKGARTYKLSGEQAQVLKARLAEGESGVSLSKAFGVAESTVSAIRTGRFHRDV
jgi:hypothetical protein